MVEYTGGSTGSSLAMICAAKGYSASMVSSDAFSEEKIRTMRAFGATVDVIPSIMRMDLVDDIVAVSDEHAHRTAEDLAQHEGIFGGTSSGANVYAAVQVVKKLGKGHRVVTIIVDSGLKYLGQCNTH